jgi:PBSX family phage portal protein
MSKVKAWTTHALANEDWQLEMRRALMPAEDREVSQQLLEDPFSKFYEDHKAVKPPFDLLALAVAPEKNSTLAACIRAMARNTLGLGWEVIFKDDVDPKDPKAVAQKKYVRGLLKKPCPRMGFTKLGELWKTDEEATGNAFLEITRDQKTQRIASIFHARAHSMRIRRQQPWRGRLRHGGFMQLVGTHKTFFKELGDERYMDPKTGEFGEPESSKGNGAHEMLHTMVYSPRSPYYGVPKWIPAALSVVGSRWADEANAAYFKHGMIGGQVVIIENGELDEDSENDLKEFFQKNHIGPDNAHRCIVLSVKGDGSPSPEDPLAYLDKERKGVRIRVEKLQERQDATFDKYDDRNSRKIRLCFCLPAIVLGDTEVYRMATANVAWPIADKQVFKPEREDKESTWNDVILPEAWPEDDKDFGEDVLVEVGFKGPSFWNEKEETEQAHTEVEDGVITVDERRKAKGLDPFGKWWSMIPKKLAEILTQQGMADFGDLEVLAEELARQGVRIIEFDRASRRIEEIGHEDLVRRLLKLKGYLQRMSDNGGGEMEDLLSLSIGGTNGE